MSTAFPAVCALNHPSPVPLADNVEAISHHTSEHASVDLQQYLNGLRPAASAAPTATSAARLPAPTNPTGLFGLTLKAFHDIPPSVVSSGSELTVSAVNAALDSLGDILDAPMPISRARFFLEHFRQVLFNAASEEWGSMGGFELQEDGGSRTEWVSWSAALGHLKRHFETVGIPFTNRKLMRVCEGLYWQLWNDREVRALADVRESGTPLSRRWRLPGNVLPRAFVPVPELFERHLSHDEVQLRKLSGYRVEKPGQGASAVEMTGPDPEHRFADFALTQEQLERQRRLEKLWASASKPRPARAGIGHPAAGS